MFSHYLLLFLIGVAISSRHVSAEDVQQREPSPAATVDVIPPTTHSRLRPRILNGVISEERDFRYQVAVMRLERDVPVLLCGGAIIDRKYVLTAAHCVDRYRSEQLVVRSGGVKGAHPNQPQNEPRSFHAVAKIMIPRQYSSLPCRKHQHDIAILKVKQSFDLAYDERYRKVNLPDFDGDYEGLDATVTGYGPDYAKEEETVNQPRGIKNRYLQYVDQLRSMPTTVISNEECQERATVVLTEGNLCARAKNPDSQTCFEDDGGPLVHDGTIIGILNDRKCNVNEPELFTRVTAYLPFIRNVLNHQLSYDILIR